MAKQTAPRAHKPTPAPVVAAAQQQAVAPAGNAAIGALAAALQQAAPTPAAPTPAALAAVRAAQTAAPAANQAQAPAAPAQVQAQVAHKAAAPKAGAHGGTYAPGSIGAQIAAACNALVALHPGTRVTAAAVLLHMPLVWHKGVQVPLAPASASCGVSHWHKAQGSLRTKGTPAKPAQAAPVAPPTPAAPTPAALQASGFSALAAAGFTL